METLGDVEDDVGSGFTEAPGEILDGLEGDDRACAAESLGNGGDGFRVVPLREAVVGPATGRFFFLRGLLVEGEPDSERHDDIPL